MWSVSVECEGEEWSVEWGAHYALNNLGVESMVWNHGMLSGEVKPGQVLLESAERQFSSSRWLTKSCACHAKWHERPRQDRTWRRRTDADQTLPRKVTYHAPQNCTKPPNTALGTKKDSLTHVPRLPSLPQNVALSPPDASLPMRLAKTTRQHHTSAAPATKNGHGHLPRKNMEK